MRSGAPLVRAPKVKPKRDRHVPTISVVACPDCKAPIGSPCTKIDGTPGSPALRHPSRRRLAVRADNLARGIG